MLYVTFFKFLSIFLKTSEIGVKQTLYLYFKYSLQAFSHLVHKALSGLIPVTNPQSAAKPDVKVEPLVSETVTVARI